MVKCINNKNSKILKLDKIYKSYTLDNVDFKTSKYIYILGVRFNIKRFIKINIKNQSILW